MSGLLAAPRVELATLPTPLRPAPRLTETLGVPVWFKRDDLTGFGLGGNKIRALEYLLGEARSRGCDCLVTGAGPQSNWAMLAALAARRLGMDAHLLYYGEPAAPTGNLLLAQQSGAQISFTGKPERTSVDEGIAALAAELRRDGRNPCELPRGGATPVGSLGYAQASMELAGQLISAGLRPRYLWLATGSGGTHAGLLAGAAWLGASYDVVGVTVSRPRDECVQRVSELAQRAAQLLGAPTPPSPTVLDGFLGPGYGAPSSEGAVAAELVARTEGVFLDPVFGAKAMAALIANRRELRGPVVFVVTGGAPTLFSGSSAEAGAAL